MNITNVVLYITLFTTVACTTSTPTQPPLPILGSREAIEKEIDGKTITDTLYHTINNFSFTDQDGKTIDEKTVENKIYVADFFFASCPTICPKMNTQMVRVYKHIQDMDDVIIISHTMDPERDSTEVLAELAVELGVDNSSKWHFVRGKKEDIFDIGNKSYMAALAEDPDAPGGNLHSGAFLLIDKKRRIRGFYDGVKTYSVDQLIADIDKLRAEE
jgi:protein SCO1